MFNRQTNKYQNKQYYIKPKFVKMNNHFKISTVERLSDLTFKIEYYKTKN